MFSDYNKKKKEFEERTKRNRDNWTASNSIGDTQGANAAHEAQKQNVAEWDKYTGGKSTYDEESGVWKYSDAPDRAAAMHMNNRIQRGEQGLREREFNYNVYDDPMFQEYIKTARRNGQAAMADTMAKGAAMTGGIAGSYAVAAGAGAYNDYMQRANDIIPELEQIAYQRYQNELARDREIYEMDEAKRWENAERDALAQDHQVNGRPMTPEEKALWIAGGGYVDANDNLVDSEGNVYEAGSKYSDEVKQTAYNDYEQNGPYNMSPENFREMQKYYKWDDRMGMFTEWDGTPLRFGGTTPEEMILTSYMGGNTLSPDDIQYMINQGYEYKDGKLYLDGEEIEKAYAPKSEMPDELWEAINAVNTEKSADKISDKYKEVLSDAGFYYDKASGSWIHSETGIPLLDYADIYSGGDSSVATPPPSTDVEDSRDNVGDKPKVVTEDDVPPLPKNTTNPKTGEDYISHGVADTVVALIVAGRYDDAEKELENAVKSGEMNEYEAKQLLKDYWNILRGGE